MVLKTIAPFGEWESVISIDDATAGSKSLSSPRADTRTGRAFFLEAKPSGSGTIIEVIPSADGSFQLKHVLTEPHGASTTVYEYGGGSYEVLPASFSEKHTQRIIFSDSRDGNSVKVLYVDSGSVTTLVGGKPFLRYADFGPNPAAGITAKWVLAVEEDHTQPKPKDVKNYVVAINTETGGVTRLVSGADFYTNARFSPDGRWISWRQWNHPEMPWTKSELRWAPVIEGEDGGMLVGEQSLVAGGKPREPVGESLWGLDGGLYWTQEVRGNDWRQMFRSWPGGNAEPEQLILEGLEEVEMGNCSMMMDWYVRNSSNAPNAISEWNMMLTSWLASRTFGFLSATSMILAYTKYASYSIAHVNVKTLEVTHLDIPLNDIRYDPLIPISSSSCLIVGSGSAHAHGVYHLSIDAELKTIITPVQAAYSTTYPEGTFSTPEHIHITSKHEPKREIQGFYWPPYNPRFTAPPDTAGPPLIVNPHGGPTSHTSPGLKIGGVSGGNVPFWTSRGFGYFAINYTGSSGHGKAYRQRLDGQWGILDRDDVPECIEYLASTGRADKSRVGIHGGSAGGYNVLQSLVWHPDVFAGGVCYCGVSDVKQLAEGTHKLEAHYMDGLLFKPGMTDEEKRAIEHERSPVCHAERIRAPLLLVHGDKDPVVPIQQSYEIERRVRENGGKVEMLVAPGEGHMFKMKESAKMALENEVRWFINTLVHK